MSTVRAAADPLFDDLALAERRVGVQRATSPAIAASLGGPPPAPTASGCVARWIGEPTNGFLGALCPEHIAYENSIADPPGTASLRRGLAALIGATEALLALAENRNLAEAEAQIQGLAGALASFTQVAAAPFGPTSGAAAVLTLLGPVAQQLQPLANELVSANNAARVRELILQNEDNFNRLIVQLREAHDAVFQIFVADSEIRIALASRADRAALQAGRSRLMNGYRLLLSNYVVLLPRAEGSWKAVVRAAKEPTGFNLITTRAAVDDARIAAEAIRRAQAAFRAGS
ncbi:hypothetical protein [Rhodovarius lipocyclicus]|uniref:hypothetical protein n=1 Tax=Rhodovarius lipocyclicus TaxID=268410 RepID=UPI0013573FF8|nr:hypothetical protein [Rhodovarius lipocyclicus]